MSGHTPGPWFGMVDGSFKPTDWNAENDDAQVSSMAPITDSKGGTVALVVSEKWDDSELDANAHLIAAAPDLLSTLETIKRRMYEPRVLMLEEVEAMIDTAIARAKGEA